MVLWRPCATSALDRIKKIQDQATRRENGTRTKTRKTIIFNTAKEDWLMRRHAPAKSIHLLKQLELHRCPHCSIAQPQLIQKWTHITVDHSKRNRRFWATYECVTCGGIVTAWGRVSKIALSRAILVPGIWTSSLSHRSIFWPIDWIFRISFVITWRPEIPAFLTAFPRTTVLILIVGIAHTKAFMLHLASPPASKRHKGRITTDPLLTTRRFD